MVTDPPTDTRWWSRTCRQHVASQAMATTSQLRDQTLREGRLGINSGSMEDQLSEEVRGQIKIWLVLMIIILITFSLILKLYNQWMTQQQRTQERRDITSTLTSHTTIKNRMSIRSPSICQMGKSSNQRTQHSCLTQTCRFKHDKHIFFQGSQRPCCPLGHFASMAVNPPSMISLSISITIRVEIIS